MNMIDFVVVAILVIIIGLAVRYIIKEKKRGVKCIGCPAGGSCCSCNQSEGMTCSCGGSQTNNDGRNHTDTESYK